MHREGTRAVGALPTVRERRPAKVSLASQSVSESLNVSGLTLALLA